MLHHREQVPFLSGQEPLDHFDLAASPFRFVRSAEPWTGERPTAALNCFADGGTNAHVIVEGWREPAGGRATRAAVALPELHRRPVTRPTPEPVPEGATLHQRLVLTAEHPAVAGHRVHGRLLLPALAYVDLVHQLFRAHGGTPERLELRDLTVLRPLVVEDGGHTDVDLRAEPLDGGRWRVRATAPTPRTARTPPSRRSRSSPSPSTAASTSPGAPAPPDAGRGVRPARQPGPDARRRAARRG
ncbi:polyketide synthase dehydratase domain-containing protein [Streptomyces albulus]|nr:polyketide synthase dehydratase domain-containing protein [Streptomyces noursei]